MYIFTLWSQNPITEKYQACINAMIEKYPELVIERIEILDGVDYRYFSDVARFRRLAGIEGPALYLDADCLPGPEKYIGGDKVAFARGRSANIDIHFIYKPAGAENEIKDILTKWENSKLWFQEIIQSQYEKYDYINGYSDYKYFKHCNYGGSMKKRKL